MHMMDWDQYRQQVVAGVSGLAELAAETVRGYGTMGAAGAKTGYLGAKTRELIAVAVSITLRCDGCIAVHTDSARKLGTSVEGNSGSAWRHRERQRRGRHRLLDTRTGCLSGLGGVGRNCKRHRTSLELRLRQTAVRKCSRPKLSLMDQAFVSRSKGSVSRI